MSASMSTWDNACSALGPKSGLGRPLAPETSDSTTVRQHNVAQMLRAIAGKAPYPDNDDLRVGTGVRRTGASCPPGGSRPGVTGPASLAAGDGTLAAALRAGPSAFAPAVVETGRVRKGAKSKKAMDSTFNGGMAGMSSYSMQAAAPAVGNDERAAQMRALLGQLNAPESPNGTEETDAASRILSQFSAARAVQPPDEAFGRPSPQRERVGLGSLGPLPEHRSMASDSCPDLLGKGKRVLSPQRKDLRSSAGRQQRRALGAGGCSMFREAGMSLAGGLGGARPPTGSFPVSGK